MTPSAQDLGQRAVAWLSTFPGRQVSTRRLANEVGLSDPKRGELAIISVTCQASGEWERDSVYDQETKKQIGGLRRASGVINRAVEWIDQCGLREVTPLRALRAVGGWCGRFGLRAVTKVVG